MEHLPEWLQELWDLNPSLARKAEKDYLALKQANEDKTSTNINSLKESERIMNKDQLLRKYQLRTTILKEEYEKMIGLELTPLKDITKLLEIAYSEIVADINELEVPTNCL